MRKAMIFCLLLFGFAFTIESQFEALPPCSADELQYMLELQSYFNLLREIEPGLDATVEAIIEYHDNQIILRNRMWWSLPPCAEAVETAALLSKTTSDVSAKAALTFAGIPPNENAYTQLEFAADNGHERVDQHFAEISALIESGARPAEPAAGDRYLADCDLADLKRLLTVMEASEKITSSGLKSLLRRELVFYVYAMLPWREGLWENLTPCAEAIRYRAQMSQNANDAAISSALSFGGLRVEENPLVEQWRVDFIELGVATRLLREWTENAADAAADLPFGTELPACSAHDTAAVAIRLAPLDDLAREALAYESLDDLRAYSDKFFDWRRALWSDLPLCAHAVEISMVATFAASDFASMMALALTEENAVGNPYREAALAGTERVRAWIEDKRAGGDPSKATRQADSLPKCAESARDAAGKLYKNLDKHYSTVAALQYVEDLLAIDRVHMSLRGKAWREFAPCREAVEAGRLLLQLMGDTVPAVALWSILELPAEDIPWFDEMESADEQILAFASAYDES